MEESNTILKRIRSTGVVPLFTPESIDEGLAIIEASYNAGIRVFEMTNRRPNSYDIFRTIANREKDFPDMSLGIGTIMDGQTAQRFIDSGAKFVIAPILDPSTGEVCERNGVMWIPGCATPTEIVKAQRLGAPLVKLFPGSVLGPQFVSSILPVVPDLKLMITGGVEPVYENLLSWFRAGAYCVGMGSHLFPRHLLDTRAWPEVQQKIETAVDLAKAIMKSDQIIPLK